MTDAAQGATGAATTAAPATPAPLGKASDLLKEVTGGETPAKDAAPAPAGDKDAAPAAKPDPDAEADERVERLARETRRLEKAQAKWKADQAETIAAAQNWKRLQDAKTKEGKLAALNILYTRDEIEQEVYVELTNALYDGKDGDTLTKEQAAKLVETKLAEAKKAEADAAKKAADEAASKQGQIRAERESGFVNVVATAYGDGSKFPHIQAMADIGKPVSGRDILAYAEAEFTKTQKVPSPEEILAHFESKFSSKLTLATKVEEKPAEKPPTAKTVTSSWSSDAPPRERKNMTLADSLEEAKREAGLIK